MLQGDVYVHTEDLIVERKWTNIREFASEVQFEQESLFAVTYLR